MKRLLLLVLVFCTLALLVVGAGYFHWLKSESLALQKLQAELKEEGVPLTPQEMFPVVIEEEDNAAALIMRAAGLVGGLPKNRPVLRYSPMYPGTHGPRNVATISEADRSALREDFLLPDSVEILDLLTSAADKDNCLFHREYEQGESLDLPDARQIIPSVRMLMTRAWLSAHDDDMAAAMADLRTGMRISRFYMEDPLFITWLVGVSCDQLTLMAMMNILSFDNATVTEIEAIEALVSEHRDIVRPSLVRALDGERLFFGGNIFRRALSSHNVFDVFQKLTGSSKHSKTHWMASLGLGAYRYPLRPLLIADNLAYLQVMALLRSRILNNEEMDSKDFQASIPHRALITRLGTSALVDVTRRLREVEASLDVALVGLKGENFRMANGRYPRWLNEFSTPIPADPFTGRDFRYSTTADSLLVYSTGPDKIDNDGNPSRRKQGRDIIWFVQR